VNKALVAGLGLVLGVGVVYAEPTRASKRKPPAHRSGVGKLTARGARAGRCPRDRFARHAVTEHAVTDRRPVARSGAHQAGADEDRRESWSQ